MENNAQKVVNVMDKNGFGQLMDRPGNVSSDEWDALQRECDKYPFCAPLQVLSLLANKANRVPLWERQSLPVAALYMQDPTLLTEHLARLSTPSPQRMAQPTPQADTPAAATTATPTPPAAAPDKETDSPKAFDILQEINAYQEVSFKTAPKSVILTNFLEKDGGIDLQDVEFDATPIQELAKKSISPSDSLQSETLALILEKQGKIAQAVAMYEKLMANNPEKSSTFAVRIALLKTQLNENKINE